MATTIKGQLQCPRCKATPWKRPGVPVGTLCVNCQRDVAEREVKRLREALAAIAATDSAEQGREMARAALDAKVEHPVLSFAEEFADEQSNP